MPACLGKRSHAFVVWRDFLLLSSSNTLQGNAGACATVSVRRQVRGKVCAILVSTRFVRALLFLCTDVRAFVERLPVGHEPYPEENVRCCGALRALDPALRR